MIQDFIKTVLSNKRIHTFIRKEGLLICIYFLILPILFVFYNEYIGGESSNIWNANYPIIPLLTVGGIGVFYSWKNNKKWALVALSPIVFYLIHSFGIESPFWQRNIEYLTLLLTIFSFAWLVYKGHVRSFSFLFLLLFSFLFYTKGFTITVGLCYIFLHFLFLVVKENTSVFTSLGLKKSIRYLVQSFLYWSPMLLFILPIKYAQKQIQNTFQQQMYAHTFIDSMQYHFQQEFTDSVANLLIPNRNITTILFVNQEEDTIVQQEEVALTKASFKPGLINEIDYTKALKEDTTAYEIITQILPKYDTLQGRYDNIYINQLYSNIDDSITLPEDYDLVTSMMGKNDTSLSYVLVLKDLSLPNADKKIKRLQSNLEISTLIAFKQLEQELITSIEQETASIDFSALENLDKKGQEQIEQQRNKLIQQIEAHQNSTLAIVTKKFNAFFPEPLLEIEPCKFWEITKLISNEIKRNANKRYTQQKQRTKAKIDNRIIKTYKKVITKVEYQFQKASKKLDDIADGIDTDSLASGTDNMAQLVNAEVKTAVDNGIKSVMDQFRLFFGGWLFYSLIGSIAFYFLVLQTFLYIFARLSISKKNNLFATLNRSEQRIPKGSIKKCGDTYTIAGNEKKVYYVSRIYEPSGRPPKFTVPFKVVSIFSRLKAKAYTMNKVDMNRAGGAVHFRAIGSSEFIEWTLKEGEEVVFDYKNLVAFSSTVSLKSEISFRVTTLILGRLFHKIAVGPGKLILMTKGRPIVSGERSSNASLAQNRILAWNKGTNFDIDSELGITDVYLSGFYLKKRPEDLIIIDADAKGKANLGLLQYIKGLIWPF